MNNLTQEPETIHVDFLSADKVKLLEIFRTIGAACNILSSNTKPSGWLAYCKKEIEEFLLNENLLSVGADQARDFGLGSSQRLPTE